MRQLRSLERWLQEEKQVQCTYQRHSLIEAPRLEIRRQGEVVLVVTPLAAQRFKLASKEKTIGVYSFDELLSTAEQWLAG